MLEKNAGPTTEVLRAWSLRSWSAVSLGAAALVAGCVAPGSGQPASEADADVGTAREEIVGGTLGGDPAVVVLQNYRTSGLCTGTLIAERVVLTAKHCIQEPFATRPANPSDIVVGVGDTVRRLSAALRVQSIDTTPGTYTVDSRGGIGTGLVGSDVAVMVLQSGMPGIEPIPVMRTSPAGLAGQVITAVGFGRTPSGQAGVKYTAMGRVQGVTEELIYVGALTCQGDSGGPAITAANEVAGVVSFGAGACGTGYGAYNTILPFMDMIDNALRTAGSCLNDGEERCDGADNDCDELVDETCTPIGGACAADDECVGLTCRETVAGQLCTTACSPLRPEFGCDPGFYCARSTGCEGYCVPLQGERGELGNEEPCTSNEQCASLFCADPGDGRRRCLQPCRGDAGMCLAGEACAAVTNDCGACVDESILFADRGVGEGCTDNSNCRSDRCYEDAGRSYCTRACTADAECPNGFHCRGSEGVCAAGPRGDIGDPCLGNDDCRDRTFCASRLDQSWCSRICNEQDPCPEGFDCVPAGGTTICAPRLALLGDPCTADEACVSGTCAIPAGATTGVCTRMCSPDAPCSTGFECRRSDDGVSAQCLAPATEVASGGCSVSANGGSAPVGLVLALLALVGLVVRRRAS
jgi:MYXO-CTERM domain-containing protein